MSSKEELAALLALTSIGPKKMTWGELAAEVYAKGSAVSVLQERTEGDSLFPNDFSAELSAAEDEVSKWSDAGLNVLSVINKSYPSRLRDIREMPPFLFFKGLLLNDDRGMSVVGSRRASDWGIQFAQGAARLLVRRGFTVIAGLAEGIDTAAHESTLESGGRTVAVIGTGIDKYYPAKNRPLQQQIEREGLVISQFLPGSSPTKYSFPMRNAVMSGYGLATIVVEATETSGTRIQARMAVQHGRPVILTSRVVASTNWATQLASRPNVYVVDGLDELELVVDLLDRQDRTLRDHEMTLLDELGIGAGHVG